MPKDLVRRLIIPLICLTLLAGVMAIHQSDPTLYHRVMTTWMLRPFTHPFLDWEWIPSAAECWNKGVNVYVDNTCYRPFGHGQHSYSPLWLRATFLPYGAEWLAPIGVGLAVAFCLAQAFLPPPRRAVDWAIRLLITCSSMVAFAVERGNADLIMFTLAVLGINLLVGHLPLRLTGYAVFLFIGLLKFYPLVLLGLALREKPRVFMGVSAIAALAVLAFLGVFHTEMGAALGNLPKFPFRDDSFGSVNLPSGLTMVIVGKMRLYEIAFAQETSVILPKLLMAMLVISSLFHAVWLSRRQALAQGLTQLPSLDGNCLIAGAFLIVGCFFAGQNVGYRGIMLLLVLPGLLLLSRSLPNRLGRQAMMGACLAILFIAWTLTEQVYLFRLSKIVTSLDGIYWLLHELTWWWVISVLLAVLIGFVSNAPALGWLWPRTR